MNKTENSAFHSLYITIGCLYVVLSVSALAYASGWAVVERIVDGEYAVIHFETQQYERIVPLSYVFSFVPLEEGMWGYASTLPTYRNWFWHRRHSMHKRCHNAAAHAWTPGYVLFRPSKCKTLAIAQRIAEKHAALRARRSVLQTASPLT